MILLGISLTIETVAISRAKTKVSLGRRRDWQSHLGPLEINVASRARAADSLIAVGSSLAGDVLAVRRL